MNKRIKIILWGLLVFLSISIAGYAFSYLSFTPDKGFPAQKPEEIRTSFFWLLAFYMHISFGGIALLTGVFQFSEKLRKRVVLHRTLGKIYLISILLGGLAGFMLSIFAEGGIIAKVGFNLLAVTWLLTSWLAYSSIRNRDIEAHRKWMLRSYAACCAAISLRLILPFELAALHMDFTTAYQIVAWACWVPNMIVIEMYIRSQKQVQLA
ncbi:DUF2306 domain-containing protein [Imperialibacter roseus]|uniref:DUF2306 domain-containing protein n=1 Tax=Imperialibacter roseus TaxID=1324217 RepID=A0ABZ0INP7_9BACT|nr:DUF2306 domain-containing protein [Imperialibacter roseus]WOK05331.1 DUF2306 domain-containing protein [Imperialibacter roseus]